MSEHQRKQNHSLLNTIFFSPEERRLHAGWRLLLHTMLLVLIFACLATLAAVFLLASGLIADPRLSVLLAELDPIYLLLGAFAETVVITATIFLVRRYLDKRSIESLGLKLNKQTAIDVLTGIGITLVQMGSIDLVMSWLGWITFEGFAWEFDPIGLVIKNTLIFFAIFVFVGWHEELLSRGYHLQTIASGLNMFWGMMISSAVFGLLHLGNPNANWISTTGIFLAGIFFAYGYIRTTQLWLPIGMHLGWNFFEGIVFGFPVSGLTMYPLARIQVHGPELWTGGAFGPEAGLIVLPALILGAVLIYAYTANQGR
jgi:membrane protease YdiL (CAAX protease family)